MAGPDHDQGNGSQGQEGPEREESPPAGPSPSQPLSEADTQALDPGQTTTVTPAAYVVTPAERPSSHESAETFAPEERRIHARIETELDCTVWAADREPVQARLRDLSHSGAVLLSHDGLAGVGDTLTIEIDFGLQTAGGDSSVTVLSEVVRISPSGYMRGYALRFSVVEPRLRLVLRELLDKMLEGQGIDTRAHPHLHRRLPITCRGTQETRTILSHIAEGELALHSEIPLVVFENVQVDVHTATDDALTGLPAQVVHVRTVEPGRYHVGLRFSGLSDDQHRHISRCLSELPPS